MIPIFPPQACWESALAKSRSRPACRSLARVVALVLILAGVASSSIRAGELRAGCAKIDITPDQPVTLSGYESRKELSQGIHDPLSARVIAFEKDQARLVFVSADILGFYGGTAEAFRQTILEAAHLKPAELFLTSIHTHSGPTLSLDEKRAHPNNLRYTEALRHKLVSAVSAALADLAPIELSYGTGASPVGVNRREVVKDQDGTSRVVLGRNTSVLTDREVQVLRLSRPPATNPAALMFSYATHSTSLGPGNYTISGDIHGLAEQSLERNFPCVAAGFAGASGDIDPWVRILPGFRTNNGWIPETVLMGTMLGQEVARVVEKMKPGIPETKVKSALRVVQLPAKTSKQDAPASSTVPFNVTVACVGPIAFVGWGGEVFNEIGATVKSSSPFSTTFIFTHCNGTAGYVPTRPSYPEGGYEAQTSPFAPEAAEILVTETLACLKQLKEAQ